MATLSMHHTYYMLYVLRLPWQQAREATPRLGIALRCEHPYHPFLLWQGVEGAQNLEAQLAEARVMSEAISQAEIEIAALMSSATQTKQVRVAIVRRGTVEAPYSFALV